MIQNSCCQIFHQCPRAAAEKFWHVYTNQAVLLYCLC
eukprot:SAG11_NODE_30185_length_303_cov_0.990196_1_plen_36_part_01